MSDNAQLARTGAGAAGAFALGGIAGGWLLAVALVLVVAGAVAIRVAFRSGKEAGSK